VGHHDNDGIIVNSLNDEINFYSLSISHENQSATADLLFFFTVPASNYFFRGQKKITMKPEALAATAAAASHLTRGGEKFDEKTSGRESRRELSGREKCCWPQKSRADWLISWSTLLQYYNNNTQREERQMNGKKY
jgi:hypothetical protein